ncbi:hypothetical protein HNY73_017666 [Argiope bruennichi]|uniref:Uncharacterized protein n=1 Tax=Argiope bruennichi TaxID=94029 RepID=A0A8T0EAQ5_ARGBR|nr:hypothetical protein HNY73_017666 [Argiope bruennichi]
MKIILTLCINFKWKLFSPGAKISSSGFHLNAFKNVDVRLRRVVFGRGLSRPGAEVFTADDRLENGGRSDGAGSFLRILLNHPRDSEKERKEHIGWK